jgi:hypothetical protein
MCFARHDLIEKDVELLDIGGSAQGISHECGSERNLCIFCLKTEETYQEFDKP